MPLRTWSSIYNQPISPCLTGNDAQHPRRAGDKEVRLFDGDFTPEFSVTRTPDFSHSTLANGGEDLVVASLVPDSMITILFQRNVE